MPIGVLLGFFYKYGQVNLFMLSIPWNFPEFFCGTHLGIAEGLWDFGTLEQSVNQLKIFYDTQKKTPAIKLGF